MTYPRTGFALGLLAVAGLLLVTFAACRKEAVGQGPAPILNAPLQAAEGATINLDERDPKTAFEKYFEPVEVKAEARVPGYELPLDLSSVCNRDAVEGQLRQPRVREMLQRQGFAVTDYGRQEDIIKIYDFADDADIPVFVTADTLLHLYHLQFDQTLKGIEEREFYPQMVEFSWAMLQVSQEQYEAFEGDLKEAARRNLAFFAVGLGCLQPDRALPPVPHKEVEAELALIEAHAGFSGSPIFKYNEDYSQYVPRGHYTRSETLKRYFKGLMWYGRISMLLKGGTDVLPSEEDAKIQTLQASLIAGSLYDPENAELLDIWNRLYSVTAFYVGLADDLTPLEYAGAISKVAGAAFEWSALADEDTLFKLKSELATYRAPKIYGGTGEVTLMPPFSPEQLDKLLEDTKGLRLMGQRFVPDSYMTQELVFPKAGAFTGTGKPFTMEMTDGGPQRCFARGLDVLAVLGSQRAYEVLKAEGDTAYADYDAQLSKLREEFGKLTAAEWNSNLYFSWVYALQALLAPAGEGYPTFMRSAAYQDRSLWAALSSWAQLRHDTILYAKQPYVAMAGAAPPMEKPKPPPGYVEPLPEFYARMLALARMTRGGLEDMNVLDEAGLNRLKSLEEIIERLLRISEIELRNEPLSEQDADYLKYIAHRLKRCIEGIEEEEDKTTIVADVLTDINTRRCLEEGVGYVKMIIVAYRLPDGRIAVGIGPVMSHYEFKQPMNDRLTDEKWRDLLKQTPPDMAPWVSSFYAARG